MSTSVRVIGFVPADTKWFEMKAVYDACINASVPVPYEVSNFFNGENPNTLEGLEIDIKQHVKRQEFVGCKCYDVSIKDLPEDVKVVRFEISW